MNAIAPSDIEKIAPGLGKFTNGTLLEVWARPALKPRDRSLVTLAALVSSGSMAQIGFHVGHALDNGVAPAEIGEVLTQLAFYTGWPNALSALGEVKNVFAARGIGPVVSNKAGHLTLEAAAEAARRETVNRTVAPTSPVMAELTNRVLFGDLWQRPDMSPRDRSLVTMAALIATGQAGQLPFHANRAMDNGLTRAEAAEIPAHLAFYAGWPRAMSAIPVLAKVFAAREASAKQAVDESDVPLQIVRVAPDGGEIGPEANFTGEVHVSTLYQATPPARIGGATVSFAAGARTAWHAHPLGQTLYIISGTGRVQREGGPVEEVHPGDVVWIPPHVRHWHGASATTAMAHFAIAEALDGKVVTWMGKVSDTEYLGQK